MIQKLKDTLDLKRKNGDDLSFLWNILKSLVFFLAIYLLFLGWVYWYIFVTRLGISFSNITLDVTSYYHYGFFSMLHWRMLIVQSIFLSVFFLLYYRQKSMRYNYSLIMVAGLLYFVVSFFITEGHANRRASNILYQHYKLNRIYFDFTNSFLQSMTKDTLEYNLLQDSSSLQRQLPRGGVRLLQYNNNLNLYLIYENDERYFALYNPNKAGSTLLEVELYSIDKSSINYATRYTTFRTK